MNFETKSALIPLIITTCTTSMPMVFHSPFGVSLLHLFYISNPKARSKCLLKQPKGASWAPNIHKKLATSGENHTNLKFSLLLFFPFILLSLSLSLSLSLYLSLNFHLPYFLLVTPSVTLLNRANRVDETHNKRI